jgi:hypothetical protein
MYRKKYGPPKVKIETVSNELSFNLTFNQPMNIPWEKNNNLTIDYNNDIQVRLISGIDFTIKEPLVNKKGRSLAGQTGQAYEQDFEDGAENLEFSWLIKNYS